MARLTTLRGTALTVAAQGLSSVTNFAVGALAFVAADGDLAAFGRFAIAFQLCHVVIAIGQGSSATSVLIHSARAGDDRTPNDVADGAATAALLIGLGLAVPILAGGLLQGGDFLTPLLLAAAGAPFLVAQYTLRAARFARDDAAGVVIADGTWLVVLLAAWAGDLLTDWDPGPSGYLAAWLLGALVSARPAIVIGLGRGRRHLATFWRTAGHQAVRTGIEGLLARSVFVVALVATEVVLDAQASGLLAAAQLVFSPLSVVHASVVAVVVPAVIRRDGIHVPAPVLGLRVAGAISAVTLAWAGVLLVLDAGPLAVGPFDLDESGVAGALFAATLLRYLAMAWWRGAVVSLRVADAARESLTARVIGSVSQWVLPMIGLMTADLDGGAYALALATWIGATVSWQQYRRLRPA